MDLREGALEQRRDSAMWRPSRLGSRVDVRDGNRMSRWVPFSVTIYRDEGKTTSSTFFTICMET